MLSGSPRGQEGSTGHSLSLLRNTDNKVVGATQDMACWHMHLVGHTGQKKNVQAMLAHYIEPMRLIRAVAADDDAQCKHISRRDIGKLGV